MTDAFMNGSLNLVLTFSLGRSFFVDALDLYGHSSCLDSPSIPVALPRPVWRVLPHRLLPLVIYPGNCSLHDDPIKPILIRLSKP